MSPLAMIIRKANGKFGGGCTDMVSQTTWKNCMVVKSQCLKVFSKGWNNNKVTLFRKTWKLDKDLVAEVTGLQKEGTKFYRDLKFGAEVIKNFPKSDEEGSARQEGQCILLPPS